LELQSSVLRSEKGQKRTMARLCRSSIPGCPSEQNRSLLREEDAFGVWGGGVMVAVPKTKGRDHETTFDVLTLGQVVYAYDKVFEVLNLFSFTNFLGVAMQMDPNDMLAIADLLWRTRPDVVVELGTNMGGSAFYYASVMRAYSPNGGTKVITLDPKDRAVAHLATAADGGGGARRAGSRGRYNQGGGDMYADATCPHCVLAADTSLWASGAVRFIHGVPAEPGVVKQVEAALDEVRAEAAAAAANGAGVKPGDFSARRALLRVLVMEVRR